MVQKWFWIYNIIIFSFECPWQEIRQQYLQSVLTYNVSIMNCLSNHICVVYYLQKTKQIQPSHQPSPMEPEPFLYMQNSVNVFTSICWAILCHPLPILLNMNRTALGQRSVLIMEALWPCWEKRHFLADEVTHLHLQLLLCWKEHMLLLQEGSTLPTKKLLAKAGYSSLVFRIKTVAEIWGITTRREKMQIM